MVLNGLTMSIIALAAASAGLINAMAGGGTLITFLLLTLLGLPPVVAEYHKYHCPLPWLHGRDSGPASVFG